MKKLLPFALLLMSITSFGQIFNLTHVKYGFKDLSFEMSEAEFIKLADADKIEGTDSIETLYEIKNPKYYSVGTCHLKSVIGVFFQGKLKSFVISIEKDLDAICIKDAFNESFGYGVKDNPYIENYHWRGNEATCILNINTYKDSDIYLTSNKLEKECDRYRKQLAKRNGSDF